MKKICAFFIIILIVFNTGLSNVFGYPRHVDPSKLIMENSNPVQLFELYGRIFSDINASDYISALDLLNSAQEIVASGNAQKSMNEYNNLLTSVIDNLNQTENGLNLAYENLRWLREVKAEADLASAEPKLEAANSSATSMRASSESLAKALGGSPTKLLQGVSSLQKMIDRLNNNITKGYSQVERIKQLKLEGLSTTAIQLSVNDSKPMVGSIVSIVGNLTDDSNVGLGNRLVEIYLDGNAVGDIYTGIDGQIDVVLNVPYIYDGGVSIHVEFWPVNGDIGVYAPCISNNLHLVAVFEAPQISIDAPSIVYPGKVFNVTGGLDLELLPLKGAELKLRFMGSDSSTVTNSDGRFSVSLRTPGMAKDGVIQITVSNTPNGTIGPSSRSVSLVVSHEPLLIDLKQPWLVFSGLSATVRGIITSNGAPVDDCVVKMYTGDEVLTAKTGSEGTFILERKIGLLSLSSNTHFTVEAVPSVPWVSSSNIDSSYFTVNSVMVFAIPFAVFIYFNRKRRVKESVVIPKVKQLETPSVEPLLTGLAGIYQVAVKIIAHVTGLLLSGSDTLREYLLKVKPRLGKSAYKVFERISKIYEHWLYSGTESKPPLKTTEKMVETLREKFEQDSN
jgi:hypothetical protein